MRRACCCSTSRSPRSIAARKREILPYLERLRDEAQVPMIYVSHDAGEIKRIATQRGAARRRPGSRQTGGRRTARRQRRKRWRTDRALLPCECTHVSARANRLPDRGNRRDALSPRRGRAASSASPAMRCGRRRCARRSRASRRSSPPTCRRFSRSKPDLVLTFSDLQADIVAELIRSNVAVHAFNQRDVAGILDMIRTLGALVGAAGKADALATFAGRARRRGARARAAAAAPAARLFRGMGRADDFRHRLGVGADRGRRRHRRVSAACRAQERQGPHRLRRRRDRRRGRTSSSAPGAARNSCPPRSRPARALPKFPRSPTAGCARSSRR